MYCIPTDNSTNKIASRERRLQAITTQVENLLQKAKKRDKSKAQAARDKPLKQKAGMLANYAGIPGGIGISHCATKYAIAVSDPWNKEAQGACVPRHPSRPSQKITIFNRFQMTLGGEATYNNSSVGIIAVCPSLANDAPTIFYGDNTLGLTSMPTTSAGLQALLPFLKPVLPNSPYSSSSFAVSKGTAAGMAVQGRVVSSGVSIQYMGSELYRGGTYTMFVSPNHDNLLNYSATSLNSYDETLIARITEDKQWLVTSGLDEPELTYNMTASEATSGTAQITPYVYPYSNGQTLGSDLLPTASWSALSAAYTASSTSFTVTGLIGTPPTSGSFYVLIPGSAGVPSVTTFTYSAFTASSGGGTFTVTALANAVTVNRPVSGGYGYGSGSTLGCIPGGAPMIIYVQPANASTTNANVFEVEYVQHVEYIGPLTSALHTPTHSDSRGFEIVSTASQRLPTARVENPKASLLTLMGRELKQVALESAPMLVRAGAGVAASAAIRLMRGG